MGIAAVLAMMAVGSAQAAFLGISTNSVIGQFGSGAKGIATSTNLAVFTFAGSSLKNHLVMVGGGLSYNITPIVAPVLALDYRFRVRKTQQNANDKDVFTCVQGGLNLELPVQPLATVGVTNFWVTPFAGVLAANGNGGSVVGSIYLAGVNVNLVDFGVWNIYFGVEYENCQGQGAFNENYVLGHIAASRNIQDGEPLVLRASHEQFAMSRRLDRLEDGMAWVASKAGLVHYE